MKNKMSKVWMAACVLGALAGCGDDDEDKGSSGSFLIGTATLGEEQNGYAKLVESLDFGGASLTVDNSWEEFTGLSDVWVRDGFVYVAPGTAPEVIKHSVSADGKLVEEDRVSFSNFEITSTAFWNNTFVSSTKAYMSRGAAGVVSWNPTTMTIGKRISFDLEERAGGLKPAVGLADRASVVIGSKAYLTAYWTDMNYAERSDDSVIIVVDSDTDEVAEKISVDCAGLDYATLDEDGNIWFSNWTGAAGTFYVLDTPETCIAKLDPKTGDVTVQTFSEITGGHQGAAFAYAGNGKFVMSVFDEVKADAANADDFRTVVAGLVWNVWGYDPKTGKAEPIEGYEANSGAVVHTRVNGELYSMVPGADYTTSTVYRLDNAETATKMYDVNGWSFRLFAL